MTHPLRKISPGLPAVTGLINIVVRRDIDDFGIRWMELNEDDRITPIAADSSHCEKDQGEQNLHEAVAHTAVLPIVRELQVDREILPFQKGDRRLEFVLALAQDPHLLSLNLGLDFQF